MSIDNALRGELLELVVMYTSGAASRSQFERLEELLDTNEEARAFYVRALDVHANLYWYHRQCEEEAEGRPDGVGWIEAEAAGGEESAAALPTSTDESAAPPLDRSASSARPSFPAPGFLPTAIHGTIGYFSQEVPFANVVAAVIVGIGLVIAAHIYVSTPEEIAKNSLPPPAPSVVKPTMEVVGKITGIIDCRWERKGLGIRDLGLEKGAGVRSQGSGLPSPAGRGVGGEGTQSLIPNSQSLVCLGDKFALASGLLQLTYDTGAKVILQGPCTYQVDSAAGGFLSLGKLTARMGERGERRGEREQTRAEGGPRRAEKAANPKSQISKSQISNPQSLIPNPSLSTLHSPLFTVTTPTATVTDLGTEFGVEVNRAGDTQTRVFAGKVRLAAAAGRDGDVSEKVLLADQTARVERGNPLVTVMAAADAGNAQFVRDLHKYAASRVISVNFTFGDRSKLDAAERTGVLHAPNWNNIDASADPAPAVELCNAAGEPTGATLSWRWASPVVKSAHSFIAQPTDSREKLLDGGFCGGKGGRANVPLTIAVGNLPFANYRVYVYYWMEPSADPTHLHTFNLSVNGCRPIAVGRRLYPLNYFCRYRDQSMSGNYQVFDGLSGDLGLAASPEGDAKYHTLFIAGLQIVETPDEKKTM